MKAWILWSWGVGLAVATLLLAGAIQREASSRAANAAGALQPGASAEATVGPSSTGQPLPPSIRLAGPVSELLKLANAGVDQSVIMAFVSNSMSPFNPGVEEIICLKGLGVSDSVINAMMQRDQSLKELSANQAAVPSALAPGTPASPLAPEPGTLASYVPAPEMPPPVDYAAEYYPPPPAADTGDSTFYDAPAPAVTGVDVAGGGPGWPAVVVVVNPALAAGSTRTTSAVRSASAPGSVAPLILHGPDRTRAVREAYPPNALVVIGGREANPRSAARQSWAWTPGPPQSQPAASSPDPFPRPVSNQNLQPVMTAAWATPPRSEPAWSAPRPVAPPARSEPQRQYAAPSRNRR